MTTGWVALRLHHVLVLIGAVVEDVDRDQNHWLLGLVLPPVRRAAALGRDVARVMHDRHRAITREFDDRSLHHVYLRRALVVAVPGNDAAGLDVELAQTEQASL